MTRERRRLVAVGVYLVVSVLAVLLIAGHGPWAGRVLLDVGGGHGVNTGDVPVLLLWAGGLWMAWLLWRGDSG